MTETSEWVGAVGRTWSEEWRRTDRSFGDLARRLDAAILAAAPSRPFRVADIGSGAGGTSLALAAARPDARVTGLDLSGELVAVAVERARGRSNLSFVAGDALDEIARRAPFDLLVSRHGAMFFADPVTAFIRLREAVAPGAPLVFTCFRDRALNPWAEEGIAAMLGGELPPVEDRPGPFAFADRDRVTAMLAAAGWREIAATPVDYSYCAGQGPDPVADAVAFFRRIGPAARLLRLAEPADRPALLGRLTAALARRRSGDIVAFPAAAWIWSARA